MRRSYSTETALIKITNDLLIAADKGLVTILVLLEHSAAFDTVSHTSQSCLGCPARPSIDCSMYRTQLPGCSPTPSPGSTSPPFSRNSTGSLSNNASLTRSSSSPIKHSTHLHPSTSPISSTPTPVPALHRQGPTIHSSHKTQNLR